MSPRNPAASRSRPLSVRAYDQLFEAIVRCDLAPGTWMKASEFSELLGVGRSPTLQALTRLEEAGFARPVKRKGWQITPVTLQGVRDVLEAWLMVAPPLAVLVVRNASDEEISALRRQTTDWAPGHPISEGGFNIDSAPFQQFVEICGNPFMAEMTRGLSAHVGRVMNFALRQGSFVDDAYNRWRDALFDAMEARDEKRTSHAMTRLVGVGQSELFRILQYTESLLSIPLRAERAS